MASPSKPVVGWKNTPEIHTESLGGAERMQKVNRDVMSVFATRKLAYESWHLECSSSTTKAAKPENQGLSISAHISE